MTTSTHTLPQFPTPRGWLTRKVKVALIGCGGTGAQVLTSLAIMDYALREMGHDGLDVTVWDDDRVEPFNVGRQPFYPADVGQYKGSVLVNRINLCYGVNWTAECSRLSDDNDIRGGIDLIVGCVDTKASRRTIHRLLEGSWSTTVWLDMGNKADSGQVVLGSLSARDTVGTVVEGSRLPVVTELFPELMDETIPEPDDVPSCSMREALQKQSLFINREMANHGMALLWDLFMKGGIDRQGAFVDLAAGRVNPMPVSRAFWERMGLTVISREQQKEEQVAA